MSVLIVSPSIQISEHEFEISFARSSGPGGQNVNKVNSKVVLKWNVTQSLALPPGPRRRFMEQYGKRLTTEGVLVITSDSHRDQARNLDDCKQKLAKLLLTIAHPPALRFATTPTYSSRVRKRSEKESNAKKKQLRKKVRPD